MSALTTANVIGLSTAAVAALGSAQVVRAVDRRVRQAHRGPVGGAEHRGRRGLSAAEVAAQISALKPAQIAAISTDAMSGLSTTR